MRTAADLARRLKAIRLIICDVDGVLTDGGIFQDGRGREIKRFSVLDGTGFVLARLGGLRTAFLSGRRSAVVTARARECGVPWVVQGAGAKAPAFESLCRRARVRPGEALYIGDDLIDLPVFERAGMAVAVSNAVPEVRRAACWVTRAPGGSGAVREVIERVLRAQGRWRRARERYLGRDGRQG